MKMIKKQEKKYYTMKTVNYNKQENTKMENKKENKFVITIMDVKNMKHNSRKVKKKVTVYGII